MEKKECYLLRDKKSGGLATKMNGQLVWFESKMEATAYKVASMLNNCEVVSQTQLENEAKSS